MLYTRACNVTRRPVSCITRPRRGEIGSSQERGDRWLFSGQRTDGWLVFSTTRGGCVTRTSDANLARVRKRKGARIRLASWRGGAREKGGMRFLRLTSPSLPPSFPTKSHPRLNFGFASRSRCENVAFVSTFRSNFSLARWIS